MSKREPLLSNDDIMQSDSRSPAYEVRDIYEAARAKDAELIQGLVDLIFHSPGCFHDVPGYKCSCLAGAALFLAKEHGFKPTEP